MDQHVLRKSWYRRPLGIAVIAYVVITGALGLWFAFAQRSDGTDGAFTKATNAYPQGATGIPPGVALYTAAHPSFGNAEDPKLVIVEFSDFQCPYCRQAYPVIREAMTMYQDRVLHVYRDFPVDELHPHARRAAAAARCANEQGKFWPYHDQLFLRQDAIDEAFLSTLAEQVGLDRIVFTQCLETGRYAGAVQQDVEDGLRLGVRGTPTWFFIPDGDITRAQKVEGAFSRDTLLRILERSL
ncbi:MAG: DsbA family protein [bacterium]|nr:DsbA family protein [bacterium]